MRVLFMTRKFPPSVGGMQLFARDLSQALAAKVDLRLVKWGGGNRALPLVLPYLFVRAKWELLKGGIEVIHAHDSLMAVPAYVLAKLWRKPYTVVLHGLDITYSNPLFNLFVPPAVRRADAVFCISQAAAEAAEQRGVAKAKIHVVPLAVRDELHGRSNRAALLEQLALPAGSQVLLTVGRLVKRKGVAWFIDNVLPGLVAKYADLIYLVVGVGEEQSNIELATRRQGLEQHVRLLGLADDELYRAAYNGADVFVMPNIKVPGDIEGFGLVVLEAALCELPVVASKLEGIQDAVADGRNGVLVPARAAGAFQTAIERFLDDKKYAAAFGSASRRFTLKNYNWDKTAGRYVEVYKSLLGR